SRVALLPHPSPLRFPLSLHDALPISDAIFAFLKVVTANVANDYFKRLHAGKRGASQTDESLEDAERTGSASGPASSDAVERSVLLDQVDACLRTVAPAETLQRDRTIFW